LFYPYLSHHFLNFLFFLMNFRRFFILTLPAAVLLMASTGCKSGHPGIGEGVIEYDCEVVDKNNPMADLAPDKMTVKFKDHRSALELTAGMGLFSTTFISDNNSKTLTQLVKLLNKKFVHVSDSVEVKQEATVSNMKIEKVSGNKMIAKFKCKKVRVSFTDNSHPPFDVWYTNEINLSNPNWNNPFHEIDGVLMEYQMNRYGLEMKFIAKSVAEAEVDEDAFQTPEEYKPISKKEMEELFKAFQ
jgi:GLPGLI family protein